MLLSNLAFMELHILALVGGTFLLPVIALIDILKNEFSGNNKLIWVLVVLLLPFFESILYFIIGNQYKVRQL